MAGLSSLLPGEQQKGLRQGPSHMAVLGQGDQPRPVSSQGDSGAGDRFRESQSLPRKQATPWKTPPDLRSGVTVDLGLGGHSLLEASVSLPCSGDLGPSTCLGILCVFLGKLWSPCHQSLEQGLKTCFKLQSYF